MSLNVLIVAEDYRNDQYILKPIVDSMLEQVGKPNANVRVCRDPMIGGVEDALDSETVEEVVNINPLFDLYLLVVDRDAKDSREERLARVEANAAEHTRRTQSFLAGQAHQEVEVWLLAGQPDVPDALEASWADVRDERQAKERYYDPYVKQKTLTNSPGGGRKPLGRTAGSNYSDRVRQFCDEVRALEQRVAQVAPNLT
jgi:hypothetical protein